MKNLFSLLLLAAVLCLAGTASAGNNRHERYDRHDDHNRRDDRDSHDKSRGSRVTRTFDLRDFDGISSSAGIDVHVTIGRRYEVKVVADRKTIDDLDIRVKGGLLHIGYSGTWKLFTFWDDRDDTDVYVTMPEVKELRASSGSEITAKGLLTGQSLKISASSAAEIDASIHYKTVKIDCSSGADIELGGRAESCHADCSSGAEIDASELVCEKVYADASSGSDIEVCALKSIHADASSGASIRYRGNPTNVNIDRSSGGSVRKRMDR